MLKRRVEWLYLGRKRWSAMTLRTVKDPEGVLDIPLVTLTDS